MGITFRHDAAAGLIGAYAEGQASADRRNKRYALQMMQRQNQHRDRMALAAARGGRGGQAGAVGGEWRDPLAEQLENPFLTDEDKRKLRVQQQAQRKAAARSGRLGKGYSGNLLPYFVPQGQLDREAEQREAERQERLLKDRRQQQVEDQAWAWHLKGIDQQSVPIPEHLQDDPNVGPQLRKLNNDLRAVLSDRNWTKEQRQAKAEEIREEMRGIIQGAPPKKTAHDEWNARGGWEGPDGKVYPERGEGEGWKRGHFDGNGDFIYDAPSPEDEQRSQADAARRQSQEELHKEAHRRAKATEEEEKTEDGSALGYERAYQRALSDLAAEQAVQRDAKSGWLFGTVEDALGSESSGEPKWEKPTRRDRLRVAPAGEAPSPPYQGPTGAHGPNIPAVEDSAPSPPSDDPLAGGGEPTNNQEMQPPKPEIRPIPPYDPNGPKAELSQRPYVPSKPAELEQLEHSIQIYLRSKDPNLRREAISKLPPEMQKEVQDYERIHNNTVDLGAY